MKVGIFDPYLDTLGGGEKYMLFLALCLSKKHDVSLFWDKEKEQEIKSGARERFGFDLDNIHFVDNIFSSKISLLQRILESQKYDVIVYLSDGSIPLTCKKNLIIHFQFPVEWVKTSFLTKLKLLQVRRIICNSQFTKSYIDRKLKTQSVVVYPPVGLPDNFEGKKENIILHVGRFGINREGSNFKKQDVMIDVFKQMAKDKLVIDWRFVLIVSVREEDREKMQNLREKASGFPIDIMENPPNEKLWEMYKKAKIYWHAAGFGEDLEKHPEKAEHFGIATAEAMGSGTVPVVINAGGQKEIVENKKSGFLWSTVDELMKKTSELINNQKLWQTMSEKGQKLAQKFSESRFCKEVESIVDSTR